MKIKFFALLILAMYVNCISSYAQCLGHTVDKFHKALVQKNLDYISKHTHRDLHYLHSNAWLETKDNMISNLRTDYIHYDAIAVDSVHITTQGRTAIVTAKANMRGVVNAKNFDVNLYIIQTWKKSVFGRWRLLARSSVKIS